MDDWPLLKYMFLAIRHDLIGMLYGMSVFVLCVHGPMMYYKFSEFAVASWLVGSPSSIEKLNDFPPRNGWF